MDNPRQRGKPPTQTTALPGTAGAAENDSGFTVEQDLNSTEALVNQQTHSGAMDSTQAPENEGKAAPDATQALTGQTPKKTADLEATEGPESPASKKTVAGKGTTKATPAGPTPGAGAPAKVSVLGDFKLVKELGAGGMGKVYKAIEMSIERPCALKIMKKELAENKDFVERFKREAKIECNLDHPNIVRGYRFCEEKGLKIFAMEFIDGGSVQGWLKKEGKFSIGDALHITLAVAHAMQHAHELNMIHRDLKPDNIMLTTKGVVKVADLGLAKALHDDMSLTQSGMGAGTPYYMSPEQAADAKHVDGRTDIYALGCMLYVFLTGEMPFKGNTTLELIKNKENGKFPPVRKLNPEVPDRLELMVEKMLQKKPDLRYQTCAELIADLESLSLANPTLSFVEGATGQLSRGMGAAAKPSAAKPAAKTAAEKPEAPPEDWWYLRYQEDGKTINRRVNTVQLHELIKLDRIDRKTLASRTQGEGHRPLATYREFEEQLRARSIQAKADKRSEKVQSFYKNIDKADRSYKRWKGIKKFFSGVFGIITFLLLLAAIGGVIFGIYWFGGTWIQGMVKQIGLG